MGRSTLFIALSLGALLTAGVALAEVGGVTVDLNDSKRIGLYGTAANVIVGDPSVADVTLVDSHSLVVIGHGYGRTRITVLDVNGRDLLDTRVTVVAPEDGRVTFYRGPAATDYSCSPRCQAVGGGASGAAGAGSSTAAPVAAASSSQ